MTTWDDLFAELDRWPAGEATFWWRDDDAIAASDALKRLLQISDLPLAIAVIPALAQPSLVEQIAEPRIDVLQHGYSHADHEPDGRKTELGSARAVPIMQEELRNGWERLSGLFGRQALHVLVPPWNRIDSDLAETLPALGYGGLSIDKPRTPKSNGVFRCNIHVDIMDWESEPRKFIGESIALQAAVTHLAARRAGEADREEPTGLLTHHLVMDDASFAFAGEFLRRTAAHTAVKWLAARDIFPVQRI